MFIAKNNDLIILAKDTREELEEALQFMVYTSIKETDVEYILYNGQYLTQEEIAEETKKARKQEILQELDKLDLKSIRALRNNETDRIEAIEQEAEILREELRSL